MALTLETEEPAASAKQMFGEPYAIPLPMVREIIRLAPLTAIPQMSAAMNGLICLLLDESKVSILRHMNPNTAPPKSL